MCRRDYSIFDTPLSDNPLARRAKQAEQMILTAGLPYNMVRPITRDAANFAGTDNDAYFAAVAWKIKAYQVEQEAKQTRHAERIKTLRRF